MAHAHSEAPSFQSRVREWLVTCFGEAASNNRLERTHRFLEEALELAQSNGCTKADAQMLIEYVFSRPSGKQEEEVGGVLVTLAGLCEACRIDMDEVGNQELSRNWRRIEAIRSKRALKPENSPLPQ